MLDIKICENIDWDKVIENTGKCSKRLILNNNIEIPENKGIGVYKSNLLYNRIFKELGIALYNNDG
ncbi:MAG: hypothetical protein II244_02185, partial [Clostridia bacterium]|nr:hypothetical protein [Clostridia bacterium]